MSTLLAILVANTLVAALLAAIAWTVNRFTRSPSLAHFFWVLALLKLVTPPLAPVPVGWTFQPERFFAESLSKRSRDQSDNLGPPSRDAARSAQSLETAKSSPQAAAVAAPARTTSRPARALRIPCTWESFALAAGGTWALGSLLTATLLAWRARTFQRSLDRCTSPDGELSRRAWRLARRAGLNRAPRVLVVDALLSPMLWGVGRRVQLVFPAGLKGRLAEEEVDSLLLHELGHYARGDHWVRVLELVCRVGLWWHPLVWVALRQIGQVEEHCCDAWVVARQAGRERSYAEALLATIDFLNEEHVLAPPVASGLGDAQLLRQRLTQIMAGATSPAPGRVSQRFAWGLGSLLLLAHPALGTVSLPSLAFERLEFRPRTAQSSGPTNSTAEVRDVQPTETPASPAMPTAAAAGTLDPLLPPATLWATATSPTGGYRIEARTGRRTTLIHAATGRRMDLSTYRITCIAFRPEQRTFFTGDEEGHLREWDCETGEMLRWWKGHLKEITSLHVAPDGRHLASGALDGLVKVWQTDDYAEKHSLQWRQDVISCVRWSADSRQLAVSVGGWSDSVHPELIVWNLADGVETQRMELEQSAGAIAWLNDQHLLMTAAWDGRTTVWNTEVGTPLAATLVRKEEVSAAAWCAECPLMLRFVQEELP